MPFLKANIIQHLRNEIDTQWSKTKISNFLPDVKLGLIRYAFSNQNLPLGAIHEFICNTKEEIAATTGFIAGLISTITKEGGLSVWIKSHRPLYPPTLKHFGIEPEKIVFIDLIKEKEVLWATEEALKTAGLSVVISEIGELNFNTSRRLLLAVEKSLVTGFILRTNAKFLGTTAFVTRWKITPSHSKISNDLPGVGYPVWNVKLLKVRNGKSGSWQVRWTEKGMHVIASDSPFAHKEDQKKTG